jgi:hypothetical protein
MLDQLCCAAAFRSYSVATLATLRTLRCAAVVRLSSGGTPAPTLTLSDGVLIQIESGIGSYTRLAVDIWSQRQLLVTYPYPTAVPQPALRCSRSCMVLRNGDCCAAVVSQLEHRIFRFWFHYIEFTCCRQPQLGVYLFDGQFRE